MCADPGGFRGVDGVGGVIDADARREQEELVDAGEGGLQRRGVAEIADCAFGAYGQCDGADGIADKDAELRAERVEFTGERAADVSSGAGDQYHGSSSRFVCRLMI